MGKLYITEYSEAAIMPGGVPVGAEPGTEQTPVTYTTTTQSSAFGAKTKFVRIHTDSICSILFGADPTATTSSKRLSADQTEYFAVTPGHKVAAVANT